MKQTPAREAWLGLVCADILDRKATGFPRFNALHEIHKQSKKESAP